MQILKADTSAVVMIGPAVDATDGVTLESGLVTAMDTATTGIRISKNGGAWADRNGTPATTVYDEGWYRVTLDTTDTNTEGTLDVMYEDATTCLPMLARFQVVNANVYDSLFAAATTDYLQVDAVQISGDATAADNCELAFDGTGYGFTSCTMPTTTSVTNTVGANVTQWLGSAAATPTTAGVPEVDITYINGAAVSTTTAQLGVNVESWNNTALPADVQAGYPTVVMKVGTGSGELDIDAGTVDADVVAIGGNATSATNLSASTRAMQILTVNTGNVAATTTTAQFTGVTETTADHFIGRKLFFYDSTDSLFLQGTEITDSSWDAANSEVVLTFQALTEAPSDADVAILV